jgi:hypothetical protein
MAIALRAMLALCALVASIGLAGASTPVAAAQRGLCQMRDTDRRWVEAVLGAWHIVVRDHLQARPRRLPPIIVYDRECSYRRASASDRSGPWISAPHGGRMQLPSGDVRSAAPDAFHAQVSTGGPFTVMGLPSIWRSTAGGDIPLGYYLEGVLLHELTHSYQGVAMPATTLIPMMGRGPFPTNLNTDSLEAAFRTNADYVRDGAIEERLLLASATARSDAEAQLQACRASDQLRVRRNRYFRGERAFWRQVDDIFLVSEGLAQWTMYVWLTRERNIGANQVISAILRSTPTHNRAFLLMLSVSRLVPDWRRLLMAPYPPSAAQLLAMACADNIQELARRGSARELDRVR